MTAIELYNSKVIELMKQREQGKIDVINFRNELDQVFERVKEMEKNQRQLDTNFGYVQGYNDGAEGLEPMKPELMEPELLTLKSE